MPLSSECQTWVALLCPLSNSKCPWLAFSFIVQRRYYMLHRLPQILYLTLPVVSWTLPLSPRKTAFLDVLSFNFFLYLKKYRISSNFTFFFQCLRKRCVLSSKVTYLCLWALDQSASWPSVLSLLHFQFFYTVSFHMACECVHHLYLILAILLWLRISFYCSPFLFFFIVRLLK